jgi:hypothetical protein
MYSESIDEVIKELQSESDNNTNPSLTEELIRIKNGESKLTDAEVWCLIRDTNLRYNEAGIIKFAMNFIPKADEYLYGIDEVKIYFDKICVHLPTTSETQIKITYDGQAYRKYPESEEPSDRERTLYMLLKLKEVKASTYKIMSTMFPRKNLATFIQAIKLKGTMKNVDALYNDEHDKRIKRQNENLRKYNDYMNLLSSFNCLYLPLVEEFAGKTFKVDSHAVWF